MSARKRPERFVVHIAGEITQGELTRALRESGLHMRTEAGHRLVIDRIPEFLRKTETTNVVPMLRRRKGSR